MKRYIEEFVKDISLLHFIKLILLCFNTISIASAQDSFTLYATWKNHVDGGYKSVQQNFSTDDYTASKVDITGVEVEGETLAHETIAVNDSNGDIYGIVEKDGAYKVKKLDEKMKKKLLKKNKKRNPKLVGKIEKLEEEASKPKGAVSGGSSGLLKGH